jgi:hypothetical protein
MAGISDEDAALSWAGDEPPRSEQQPVAGQARAELLEPAPAPKAPTPAVLLITYGILGGIYLIYTIGWIITVQRMGEAIATSSEALSAIMFQLGQALAIASPAIWFGAALVLTRGRKPLVRLLLLVAGLVAVLPWSFVLGAWLP